MPVVDFNRDKCSCGSGRFVSDCCMKSCGNLLPTTSDGATPHDKCYARQLGDCCSKISGEHWISANVLKCIEPHAPITIGGLPWQLPGTTQELSAESLQSNVLCRRHNQALSPLDTVGGRFFRSWPHIPIHPAGNQPLHLFDGHDIERWMLKLLCGAVASGVIEPRAGRLHGWQPPLPWLQHLYYGAELPAPLGLYLCQRPGEWVHNGLAVEFTCVGKGLEVYALDMRLHGFRFILTMVPPANPLPADSFLSGAAYRPSAIVFSNPAPGAVLLLAWGPDHTGDQFNVDFLPS